MATSGELRALLARSRAVLEQVKAKQVKVGGGSGRRERYEMRQTSLYFDLGTLLLEYFPRAGIGKERRSTIYAMISEATKDLDLHEGIIRWSVRFVEAFEERDYFSEVSKLCRDSLGQLREVVDLLARSNPLQIGLEDLDRFRERLRSDITYDEMRREAKALRAKYTGGISGLDFQELQDMFSAVEQRIMGGFLDETAEAERQRLRERIGPDSITALRYTLMLLSREQTLEEARRKSVTALSKARGGDPILDEEVARLHKALLDCLSGDKASRDRLRSWVPAASMGQLQKILKALESEKEYQNYRRTEKLFKTLFDSNA